MCVSPVYTCGGEWVSVSVALNGCVYIHPSGGKWANVASAWIAATKRHHSTWAYPNTDTHIHSHTESNTDLVINKEAYEVNIIRGFGPLTTVGGFYQPFWAKFNSLVSLPRMVQHLSVVFRRSLVLRCGNEGGWSPSPAIAIHGC